jgi:hypothetical protein
MADELLSRDCFNGLTEDNQLYEILQALGSSSAGIASINGDTTAAQLIAGSAPLSASTAAGTTTISSTQAGAATAGYLSSTDWNTFNNKTFCITLGHSSTTLSAGGTNTYFANLFDLAPASPSFRRQFKFPFNGTIVAVSMTFYNGGGSTPTGHSGATMSLYNVDTPSTVATLISYNVNGVVSQDSFSQIATGLNIPVVANTAYNIFLQGGTFTTNPTSVRQTINLFIQ